MSKSQLNRIIQYTPIDLPIRLKNRHYFVCTLMAFLGLGLYYANLDDATTENILTNYLGVLSANFAGIFFAGADYFKDKLEREIPEELKGILEAKPHRTTSIVSGSLAAALPYAGMTWESAPINYFSSKVTNKTLTVLFAIITWLVNAFMNNIPVRDVLENEKIRWGLFWLPLLLYYGSKELFSLCKLKRKDYARLLDHFPLEELKPNEAVCKKIIDQIDRALSHVASLDDMQLSNLYSVIYHKNYQEADMIRENEEGDADYFEHIMRAAIPPPQLSLTADTEKKEAKKLPFCSKSRTTCTGVLDHPHFKKRVLLMLAMGLAGILLLADSQYVLDSSEDMADSLGIGAIGRKVFGYFMVYLAMTFAFILNTDFCRGTLEYFTGGLSGVISPAKAKSFGSRFYPYTTSALTLGSGYLSFYSSTAGVKLYSEKMSNSVLVFIAGIAIRCFNFNGFGKIIQQESQHYAHRYGKQPAQQTSRINSFFNLLKKRVEMVKSQSSHVVYTP